MYAVGIFKRKDPDGNELYHWTAVNGAEIIQHQLGRRGKCPATARGTKLSFHYYARTHGIPKTEYILAQLMGGVTTIQGRLL